MLGLRERHSPPAGRVEPAEAAAARRAGLRSWRGALLERLALEALRRLGRPQEGAALARSCLVLAPHPDDETLGCGATILRKRELDAPVWVVLATDGRHSHRRPGLSAAALGRWREREGVEACRRLGVPPERVIRLGYEEGRLDAQRSSLTARLGALVRELRPEEVRVTSGLDRHPDHRALHRAAVDLASRGSFEGTLLEYPVWFWRRRWYWTWAARAAAAAADRPWRVGPLERLCAPWLVATEGYLARKRHALLAHATQMRRPPDDPGWSTLEDVGGGRFLQAFFRDHEVFFELRRPR